MNRRFVVLLRGVNVGKAARLPMADFRALLESMGFVGVRTLLNSGNAIVTSPQPGSAAHAAAIREALAGAQDCTIGVIVKSREEMGAIITDNPFGPVGNASNLLVAFAQESGALHRLSNVAALAGPHEQFHIGPQAAYLHCPDGLRTSKAGAALLGKAGNRITTRNWNTVLKIKRMLGEPD